MLPPAFAEGQEVPIEWEDSVFSVLLGDIALFQGNLPIAVEMWSILAQSTLDERALARATELAVLAKNASLARRLVGIWQREYPQSQRSEEWFFKSLILYKENFPQLKLDIEKKLKDFPQKRAQVLMYLPSVFLMNKKNIQEAKKMLEELTQPYLSLKESHLARAQMMAALGDFILFEKELDEALKIDPHLEDALILKSSLYLDKNPKKAIEMLKEYVAENQYSKKIYFHYLRALITTGEIKTAMNLIQKLKIGENNIEECYSLTLFILQKRFYKEGKELLNQLSEYKDINLNQIHYLKAQIAIEEKKNDEAIFHLEKVTRQNDVQQYLFARTQLAQLLAREGKLSLARARLFSSQTANDLERAHFIVVEAQILNENDHKKEAFSVLKKAVEKYPENIDLKYELAMMADRLKDYAAMEKYLRLILKTKPQHAHALNALGYSFADRGIRLKEAEKLIQQSLSLEKENPYILDSLGWVYFKQGKLKESLKIFEKALSLKEDAEISAHYAEVLYQLNEKEKSNFILNEALKKNPEHPALKKFLERYPR